MGDSSTAYNALSGTQAVTCEVGPGTHPLQAKYGIALATDLKQGDVIYLSCHIALKSVTGLARIGFEPVIDGQYARCWLANPTGDFDGIITKSYTVSADVPAGTNLHQSGAYIQPFPGKTFTVADGGYVRIDHLMMSIGQPAAWAPAKGETITADGGGGGMTEPTNLVKTQPDETATYTVKAMIDGGHKDFLNSALENIKLSANTSFHIGITIKPDKDIPSGRVWTWIHYKDDAGATNFAFANSSTISYVIPAGVWTRLEWAVTVPAGMSIIGTALSFYRLADETKFQATNFVVYPLTGGRIVRARGATALVSVNDGAKGEQGIPGKDGKSPTVSVSKSGTVTTIVVTNADGSKTTQTVNDGVNGTPGTPGADGKTPYFHVKYSNDGGKTFTANGGETAGTYIGTCTDYNSADPTAVGSYTWAKIKGETGPGFSAIVEQYYLSTSSTTQTGGSWSTTSPAWQSGHYIWTRSQITWTTGAITYTTPVLANGLNSANSEAKNATTIANGKNKVTYSATANPSGTSGYSAGDIWFNKSTGGIWQFNGSKWNLHQVGTSSIANGAITADKVAANAINAQKINVDVLSAISANLGNIIAGNIKGVTITGSEIKTNWNLINSMSGQHARVRLTKDNFYFDVYTPYADETPTNNSAPTSSQKFYFGNRRKGEHDYLRGLWLEGETGDDHEMVYRVLLDPYDGAADSVMIHNGDGEVAFQSGGYIYGQGGGHPTKILNKNYFGEPINSMPIGTEPSHTISFGWTGSRLRPVIDGNQICMPVIDTIFDNANNGMGSGVSLTSAATNYDALDIFCKTDDGTQIYTKVCNPTVGTTFEVSVNHIAAGGGNMWIKTKQFKISSSTYITTANSGSSYFTGNVRISSNSTPATVSQSDNITIIKVVGWKY